MVTGAPLNVVVLPSLIAPVAEGRCFGGAEMMALELTEALAQLGHHVIMIGLPGSEARGAFVLPAPGETSLMLPGEEPHAEDTALFTEIFHELAAMAKRDQLDAVHLHLNDAPALLAADAFARRFPKVAVVSTLHLAAVFPSTTRAVQALLAQRTPLVFAAPSLFAAKSYGPGADVIRVIPNGVPTSRIAFHESAPADRHLAWAGRRSPEKGPRHAIAIAQRAGRPITIAGTKHPDDGAGDAPHVTDLGRVPREEVPALFGGAECTLITSSIAEAHPLVALESLAAGTPVVAFAAGGLPEIVTEGVNGFLVPPGDVDEAVKKLELVPALSRRACREDAERRFDQLRMVRDYEIMYRDWRPWPT